jgi:hypothetical protein
MSSNIVFENIDEQYPVAGIDNDSQGFRDNFLAIKTAIGIAKEEISTLNLNTAKINEDNNFSGSSISDAELQNCTLKFFNAGTITASAGVNYASGQYQTLNIVDSGNVGTFVISLFGFPGQNRLASMRLQLKTNVGTSSVGFVTVGGSMLFDNNWPTSELGELHITTSPSIIEFWTYDGGSTVFARYIGEYFGV